MSITNGLLAIATLIIAWSLYRAQRDPDIVFNLYDLLVENGRVSRLAFAFMTTLFVTSWVVIKLATDGKMNDVIFASYGAMWVAPIIAKLFSPTIPSSKVTEK